MVASPFEQSQPVEKQLTFALAWVIWGERNKLIFPNKISTFTSVLHWTSSWLEEYLKDIERLELSRYKSSRPT